MADQDKAIENEEINNEIKEEEKKETAEVVEIVEEVKEEPKAEISKVTPKTISQLSKEKEITIGEIKGEFSEDVDFKSWLNENLMAALMNKKENRSK